MTNSPPKIIGNYELVGFLGEGRYATVRVAQNMNEDNEETYALKIIDKTLCSNVNPYFIKRERQAYQRLKNAENLCKFYEYFEDDDKAYFVMEKVDGYNLQRELFEREQSKRPRPFSFKEKKEIMMQIIRGVKSMHAQNVYHGDLKPENILLSGDKVYLIDLGCSLITKTGWYPSNLVTLSGTAGFAPPETLYDENVENDEYNIVNENTIYHVNGTRKMVWAESMDVWALASTFCYIFCGVLPLTGPSNYSTLMNVRNVTYNFKDVNQKVVDICKKVFQRNLEDRLDLKGFENEIRNLDM